MTSEHILSPHHLSLLVRWSIVITLWTLLISMASGQSGIANFRDLLTNNDVLEKSNAALEYEVSELQREIANLNTSASARKHFLKNEIGVVEAGELVYHFPKHVTRTVVER
jgi:cell division protein FtsB